MTSESGSSPAKRLSKPYRLPSAARPKKKETALGELQFCAFKDGKCIVDVWAGTMTTNAGAAKKDDVNIQDLQMATVAKGNAASAGSVASFCERAKKGDRLTVAFLGGSRKEEWFSWRLVRTWEGRSEEHLN